MATEQFQIPIVRCRGLTKHFGSGENRIEVLHKIDLDVTVGALTLLIGPSGCGKTTMLSILAGLLDPTTGDVQIKGTSLMQLNSNQKTLFRRLNIGFVFQQYQLLPALSAAENVAVPLIIAGMRKKKAIGRAEEILERLGLGHRLQLMPIQLSYGQQQRVAIARALIHEPCLLLCDEPTSALDAEAGRTVMELLCDVAVHPNRAVIVVTHDNRIFNFADQTIEMNDGRIVRQSLTEVEH